MTAFAQADISNDAARLLRTGQIEAAASKVEQGLSTYPKDAQLRFLRGVIQIEQRKNTDAINTFSRLIEDYPELPEPYNNLAVLYGGMGQYDKARAALELAIRTHPSYATAHENLGDVYTKLASESYGRALQLDTGNNAAQFKLNIIKDLSSGKPTKPTAPAPVVIAAVQAAPAVPQAPVAKPVVASPPAVVAAPVAIPTTPAVTPTTPTQPAASVVAANGDKDEVLQAVSRWSKAWSAKNVESYLAQYGKGFAVPGGDSRKSWEEDRRARIVGKSSISVGVESPEVKFDGGSGTTGTTATVSFRQNYKADTLATSTRKTLTLQKQGGEWKIMSERTGASGK